MGVKLLFNTVDHMLSSATGRRVDWWRDALNVEGGWLEGGLLSRFWTLRRATKLLMTSLNSRHTYHLQLSHLSYYTTNLVSVMPADNYVSPT